MIAVRMEGIVYVDAKRVAEAIVSCQLVDSARGRASSDAHCGRSGRAGIIAVWRSTSFHDQRPADSVARSSNGIHPTAIVDPRAKIHPSCKIGPYCVIGPQVEFGEGCHLVSHVTIEGPTKIGTDNGFFPFCSIGMAPQDLTYAGEPTRLEIGDHNEIREFVTINRGTVKGGGLTRVGSHMLVMAYTHIAHDCDIGDHVILANAATLGGHVTVGEWAVVGALCPVHHFVRIGAHAFIGGGTTITRDVLPFSKTAAARDTHAYGMNALGLERRGFSKERIRKIHHAYKLLQASKLNTSQAAGTNEVRTRPGRRRGHADKLYRSVGARSDQIAWVLREDGFSRSARVRTQFVVMHRMKHRPFVENVNGGIFCQLRVDHGRNQLSRHCLALHSCVPQIRKAQLC